MSELNKSIKGKLYNYFHGKLDLKNSTKGYFRTDCIFPGCDGRYTLALHIEKSRVYCFKCATAKSTIGFLMYMEKFELISQAYNFLKIQQEYEAYDRVAYRDRNKEYKTIDLPESYNLISQGDSVIGKAARAYMKKRGFNIDKLALKGVGYCTRGDYQGYIIFPFYERGVLKFFQGRLFMASGLKMKNPESDIYGVGKSQVIYNRDALFIYNKVYVLESITNSLTLGDNACGILGKKCSQNQMSNIIESPCQKIVIILDPDAISEALDLAMQLVPYKKTKLVKLPMGFDVNDLGRKKTLKLVSNTHYKDFRAFYHDRLNNLI